MPIFKSGGAIPFAIRSNRSGALHQALHQECVVIGNAGRALASLASLPHSAHLAIRNGGGRGMLLIEAARAARENAYAPYSRFGVGAALCTPDGTVFSGCNVENAAYPEGTCAEAGAIAAMVAAGQRQIAGIAVIADSPVPVPPCGGCRQKIAEFSGADVPVTLATTGGAIRVMTVAQLLPGAFAADHMAGS